MLREKLQTNDNKCVYNTGHRTNIYLLHGEDQLQILASLQCQLSQPQN
jgi:hypothetical protein